jgi:hypothetical protein
MPAITFQIPYDQTKTYGIMTQENDRERGDTESGIFQFILLIPIFTDTAYCLLRIQKYDIQELDTDLLFLCFLCVG